jgi:hypothetical protein
MIDQNEKVKQLLDELLHIEEFSKFEQTADPLEDVTILKELRKNLHEKGKEDIVEILGWEIQTHYLVLRSMQKKSRDEKALGPMFKGTDDKGQPFVSPNLDSFTSQMIEYFKMRLQSTSNPLLRARFSDIIWIRQKDYSAAQEGIEAYLESAEIFFDKDKYHQATQHLGRGVSLALETNSLDQLKKLYDVAKFFLWVLESKNQYRWVIDILNNLLEIPTQKNVIDYDLILKIAERGYKWACPDHPATDTFVVAFLKIKEVVYQKQGNDAKFKECRLQEARCYETIGHYAFKANQFMKASDFFQKAIQKYIALGGHTAKVDEIKKLLKESNEKASKYESQTITTEVEVPTEKIQELLSFLKTKNVNEILLFIASESSFLCSVQKVKSEVEKLPEVAPLLYLINPPVQDARGNIVEILDTPEKKLKKGLYENLDFHYEFFAKHWLIPIFDLLKNEKQCTALNFKEFFSQFDFFDDDTLLFLENGISNYIDENYVASIHILTFRIEAILRRVLVQLGVPTCSTRDGKTQEKNLEGILAEEKLRSALGEDIVTFLEWFLIDRLGFNLRHNVAHGLLEYAHFSEVKNALLIYALLLFTRFSFQPCQM